MFSDEDVEDQGDVEDNENEDDLNEFDAFEYRADYIFGNFRLDGESNPNILPNGTRIIEKIPSDVMSLKNICLKSISKNVSRFNAAFSITEDVNFRRNLHYLRKVHYQYLIEEILKEKGELEESYLDFLIHEHVKGIQMAIFPETAWKSVIKRISEVGHKVNFMFKEKLLYGSDKYIDFVNKVVCHLTNVEYLNLNSWCDDRTLEIIGSSCLLLNELHFNECPMTEEGLKFLCQKNKDNEIGLKLKILNIPDTGGVQEGITYLLQNMPSLEVIEHNDLPNIIYDLHKEEMNDNTLRKKYNLTTLHLGASAPWEEIPSLSEMLALLIDVCPLVKEISLSLNNKEHLDLCLGFPELEIFCVINSEPSLYLDINGFLEAKGRFLKKLEIERFHLSAAVLTENCKMVEDLNLTDINFQPLEPGVTLNPLKKLSQLQLVSFRFHNNAICQSLINILNASPNVEKLVLSDCRFGNNEEIITNLSKFCEKGKLQHLKFINCDVQEPFLQSVLLTCTTLNTLSVEYCDNIFSFHIDNLYQISQTLKNDVCIDWIDNRSEVNSIDSNGDGIFDDYYDYDSDDYEYYDSDNLYYAYDSDGY
ncbi:uncharacterized protein CEXT_62281 [Caerostris extrusa]|uniref:RNI-like protein n=1 Tax=Caerostris extrusa TaxID=172846 RepID=A0AAV4R808_CAEEX|nr:uncharacterized protein CEXT_62281 [Caerostris extrusa]